MKWKKSIRVLAMLLFSALFLTSAYRVFFYLGESRAQEAAFGELEEVIAEAETSEAPTSSTHSNIEEPTMPAMLPGYAALYEENHDLFGWVQIEDTKLNYPVMYTPDDQEYYLRRAFDGSEAVSGVPFLDGCRLKIPN